MGLLTLDVKETMNLLAIDYVIIGVYFTGILGLGFFLTRYIKSAKDYFLASRVLPFWAIGMSIVVSDIGATDMMGLGAEAYFYGISVANMDWIGSFPAMIIAAFIFIPYYWRSGVYTIPEFLGRRFNSAVQTIYSLFWIAFIALNVGVVFYGCGVLLAELVGWDYWFTVIFMAIIIGLYAVTGGLSAVVLTDVAQLIIMFIGGFAIVAIGLWEVGGWNALVAKVYSYPECKHHFDLFLSPELDTPYPWTGVLFGLALVMSTAYFICNQTIVQRTLGAKDEWNAKASMLVGAFFKAFIPLLVVTPGLIALAKFGPNAFTEKTKDHIIPVMIKTLLPPGMRGLMFVAFLAALMSSIDSMLNSVATLWTKDIHEKFLRPKASDRELLFVGRAFTLGILIFGAATSKLTTQFEGMYQYLQTLLSVFQGPTLAILLMGIFWKRCTPMAGLGGLILGVASSLTMHYCRADLFTISEPFFYVSFWSFLFTLIVTYAISLYTKPLEEEKLYGLVYGLVKQDSQLQKTLEERANGDT